MLPLLAGPANIYGCGMLELGMSFSLEQLVIDNDIIGNMKYADKGFEVNEQTLSFDVISEVGIAGDYIPHMDTIMGIDIPSNPEMFDRCMLDEWCRNGSKTVEEMAHDKVVDILKNHECTPVDSDVRKQLDAIIKSV